MGKLLVGVDIGSTTIKTVVLSENKAVRYSNYVRHNYKVPECFYSELRKVAELFSKDIIHMAMTGTGALTYAEYFHIPFIQEVAAEGYAIKNLNQHVDVTIELGGEDSKISYFQPDGTIDMRMNRNCASGTGAFLEHLAALFGTDINGLDELAKRGKKLYLIASRCGVFAKTDVQTLLNQGAKKEDLAYSVYQAVVNQVLTELGRGKHIDGKVAFLGGALTFLPELRKRFINTLGLSNNNYVAVKNGELYAAFGAALTPECKKVNLHCILKELQQGHGVEQTTLIAPPLFKNEADYLEFKEYYKQFTVPEAKTENWSDVVWIGIDAGSTTLKLVAINKKNEVVYCKYQKNAADILGTAKNILLELYQSMPVNTKIAACGITGYGEEFLKQALCIDYGEVETLAHLKAARTFCPKITSLLDIGGQDMKYIQLQDGVISRVALNGACASGCGIFLETFADTLHLNLHTFVEKAIGASDAINLGHRCTVLMNSQIRQIQRDKIDTGALIAGLCRAVVENALYRVIRLNDISDLGDYIVVEGGTFNNDAVLRAFEQHVGHHVIRPNLAGLMGAFGMALLVKEKYDSEHSTSLLSKSEIENLNIKEEQLHCPGCGNHCLLHRKVFPRGNVFVTGNRCSNGQIFGMRGSTVISDNGRQYAPNLAEWEKERVFKPIKVFGKIRGRVGIPQVLRMWQEFPYWNAFWSFLGYEVVTSSFETTALAKTAVSVPQGVYCYPCKLTHAHIYNLLIEKKPDFIWMPVTDTGIEEPELDELAHSSYGDIIAKYMNKEIQKSDISFYHPRISGNKEAKILAFMRLNFPELSAQMVRNALKRARDEYASYKRELSAKTARILDIAHKEKKIIMVLVGRCYHIDPEINKGIPSFLSALGVPVLTAEGLYSLKEGGSETPAFRELSLYAAHLAMKDSYLQLIQLQSTSCGYDGITLQEIRENLQKVNKVYTVVNLDQGVSTGAIQIRIRSLLAEIKERKSHPEIRVVSVVKEKMQELPNQFYFQSCGLFYDRFLQEMFKSMGYKVAPLKLDLDSPQVLNCHRDIPFVILSSAIDAHKIAVNQMANGSPRPILFLGLGRKNNQITPSTTLFHRVWVALFLGDLLLRIWLSLPSEEQVSDKDCDILPHLQEIFIQAIREKTFAAYEKAIQTCMSLLTKDKHDKTLTLPVGIVGNPFLYLHRLPWLVNLADAYSSNTKIRWNVQGLAEALLNELTELYFLEGFHGDNNKALTCMSSRVCAHTCLEIMLKYVNRCIDLDSLESPGDKKIGISKLEDAPDRNLTEPYRDALRRGAVGIIDIGKESKKQFLENEKFLRIKPETPLLVMNDTLETLSMHDENRIRLFFEEIDK